jgi:hypothetical protein
MTTPRDPLYAGCRSCRAHQLCGLAVFPVPVEPSHGTGGSRHLSHIRDDPAAGPEVRSGICQPHPSASPCRGDKWHQDEVLITIAGEKHWLWRAVDQEGFVLDVLVQSRHDKKAAKRLFRKLLKK